MSLTQFLKATGNIYATVADDGIIAGDVSGFIDTGSYALNALLCGSIYGGLPGNKITAIGAPSSTGKTFFALGCLKGFLNANPTAFGFIFESESALTKDGLKSRGIDTKRVGIIPVATVQDFRTAALKILDNYDKQAAEDKVPMFFVLDSMGMLSTDKEIEDTLAGEPTKDMTRAALLKATFRVLTLKLGRLGVPLFVTNHVYAAIGGSKYDKDVQGGGTGMVYAASSVLSLSKAKDKDDKTKEVTGVIVTVTHDKGRLTKENIKVKCLIKYDGGLDRYFWLTELAEKAGVWEKLSTQYIINGKKYYQKSIEAEPEKFFTSEVLDKIDEWTKANFTYGANGEDRVTDEDI